MKAKDAENISLTKLYADQEEQYKIYEKLIFDEITKATNNKEFSCPVYIQVSRVTLTTLLKLITNLNYLGYKTSYSAIQSDKTRILTIKWGKKPIDTTWWERVGNPLFGIIVLFSMFAIPATLIIYFISKNAPPNP